VALMAQKMLEEKSAETSEKLENPATKVSTSDR